MARKNIFALSTIGELIGSHDGELRAQAAKLLREQARTANDMLGANFYERIVALIADDSPRVRYFAILLLSELGGSAALEKLLQLSEEPLSNDAFLRQAITRTFARDTQGIPDNEPLKLDQVLSRSESTRLITLGALRTSRRRECAAFLSDVSPRLRLEAARAIHDAPIPGVMPALAAFDLGRAGILPAGSRILREPSNVENAKPATDASRTSEGRSVDTPTGGQNARPTRSTANASPTQTADAAATRAAMMDSALTRRVINANYRLGTAECAARLAGIAANSSLADAVRLDAFEALAQWPVKLGRDRVLGIVVEGDGQRKAADAAAALEPRTAALLGDKSDAIRIAALNAAGANKLTAAVTDIELLVAKTIASGEVRAAALRALGEMDSVRLGPAVFAALDSGDKTLAEAARKLAGKLSPALAVQANAAVLGKGPTREQQEALANIAATPGRDADRIIAQQLDLLLAGKLKAGMILDLLEAAETRDDADIKKKLAAFESARKADDPLSRWRECLEGGDGKTGKQIFAEKAEAACMRCHKVRGVGGDVGPDLAEVGKKMGREFVLRSIVDPNAVIAKGYDNVMVTMKGGDIIAGLLTAETADDIALKNPADGKLQRVKKSAVKERASLPSAMPPGMGEILGKRALRDVVQYLSTLK